MMDILDKLNDLHEQATKERSHYYVASTAKEAAKRIASMETSLKMVKSMLVGQHNAVAAAIIAVVNVGLE